MKHIMTILEVEYKDADGAILWADKNLKNVMHVGGQEFILNAVFRTASGITVPSSYYLGLDARPTPAEADTLANIAGEPVGSGYQRQDVNSVNGFTIVTNSLITQATSSTVIFSATGTGWGPVRNLFLATGSGSSGFLIATAPLSTTHTLTAGQTLSMRIGVKLRDD